MVKERIAWQNPNFRVIDGMKEDVDASRDSRPISFVDRVMDEIGDALPFEIIEGGKTEATVNDRIVMVVFDLSEIPQIKSKTTTNKLRYNWDKLIHAISRPSDGI